MISLQYHDGVIDRFIKTKNDISYLLIFSLFGPLMYIADCCSLGADPSHLTSVAADRLQAELVKDGREPAEPSSFKVPKKAPAGTGRSAFSHSLTKKKGQELEVQSNLTFVIL